MAVLDLSIRQGYKAYRLERRKTVFMYRRNDRVQKIPKEFKIIEQGVKVKRQYKNQLVSIYYP